MHGEMPGILNDEALESLAAWLSEDSTRRSTKEVADLLTIFDVRGTARRVVTAAGSEQFNVALQFPDSLIQFAPLISEGLRVFTDQIIAEEDAVKTIFYFVLGDTSYGECCVDEVAAQHLGSHMIVHYGNTCFSPTRTLSASFIFPNRISLDPERTCNNFQSALNDCVSSLDILRVVLLFDVELHSLFESDKLRVGDTCIEYSAISDSVSIEAASLRLQNPQDILQAQADGWNCDESKIAIGALAFDRGTVPMKQTAFIWCTSKPPSDNWPAPVRNAALQLTTGTQETCAGFFSVSLTNDTKDSYSLVNSYAILKKRFAVIDKVKDAQRIGIIPGTLGISGNVEAIERCKRVIDSAKKRSYTILVGKPNPSKLANFPEIDVFVLVACPYNALIESRDYLQPIVTPLELEAALLPDRDIYSMVYSTDFRDLLKEELQPDVCGMSDSKNDKSLSARGNWSVSVLEAGSAAEYLRGRSWQGLQYSHGSADDETSVGDLSTSIRQGQSGIASRYDKEAER